MNQYQGGQPPYDPYYGRPPVDPYAQPPQPQPSDPYLGQPSGDPYAPPHPGDPYYGPPPGDPYYGPPPGDPYAQQAQYQAWQAQQQAYRQAPAPAARPRSSGGAVIAGIFLVLLGGWFLLRDQVSIDLGHAWPVVAVALGALMVIAAFIPRRQA
jgi:hypothetical protein